MSSEFITLIYTIVDAVILAFLINAPIQIIITVAQWLLMARFLAPENKSFCDAIRCLGKTYISAFAVAVIIWLFWPLSTELIMYNNRISIPAVLGEMIVIPFWLKRCGYIKFSSKAKDTI